MHLKKKTLFTTTVGLKKGELLCMVTLVPLRWCSVKFLIDNTNCHAQMGEILLLCSFASCPFPHFIGHCGIPLHYNDELNNEEKSVVAAFRGAQWL